MKRLMIIGIVLIAFGVLALSYEEITYAIRENIIDIGTVQTTNETRKTVPVSPIVGRASLDGGIILLLLRANK